MNPYEKAFPALWKSLTWNAGFYLYPGPKGPNNCTLDPCTRVWASLTSNVRSLSVCKSLLLSIMQYVFSRRTIKSSNWKGSRDDPVPDTISTDFPIQDLALVRAVDEGECGRLRGREEAGADTGCVWCRCLRRYEVSAAGPNGEAWLLINRTRIDLLVEDVPRPPASQSQLNHTQ